MIGAVNIWDWLAFVIFFALAVAATYRLPRYWRGETSVIPLMSRWPLERRTWRAQPTVAHIARTLALGGTPPS